MVSILLSVLNGARSLPETLTSIDRQTFSDWELIAVDDASIDDSFRFLGEFQQKHLGKVTVLRNERNLGLTRSLIRAAGQAQTKYIARIDAGDRFISQKLEKQVAFLEQHPDYAIVGCNYVNVFLPSSVERKSSVPLTDGEIRKSIVRKNPFAHSCVVMRTDAYRQAGGYDAQMRFGQDYDLWFRMLKVAKAANLEDSLCIRTVQEDSVSGIYRRPQMWQTLKTQWKYMSKANPVHYAYLIEPLVMMLIPGALKKILRPY